jgi:hypothetical protein
MRRLAVVIALAIAVTWSLGTPAAWAKQCPKLYKECQEALKTSKADAETKENAKKICDGGIALHNTSKSADDHDLSVRVQKRGLALLGIEK